MNAAYKERRALKQQLIKGIIVRARNAGMKRSTAKIKAESKVMIARSVAQQVESLLSQFQPQQSEPMAGTNGGFMENITAELRVTAMKVQPFAYRDGKNEMVGGESLEMRAAGFWEENDDLFPLSLHVTVYPGHGVVPAIGDNIRVTIERSN